jgi:hypothetical protein
MSSDIPLGGFLTDWEPTNDHILFLDQYLIHDKKLKNSPVREATPGNENYLIELDKHFGRLINFLNSTENELVNLVFGNVQSGKTSHLRANICWARDNQFDLVILLNGSKTDLGDQTVETIENDLPQDTVEIVRAMTVGNLDEETKLKILSNIRRRSSDYNFKLPLISLIKSPKRLEAVKDILEFINPKLNKDLRILILDDEADEVSADPDAGRRKAAEVETVRRIAQNRAARVSIHKRIIEIRKQIVGKHIYLAYTATPQALILGDLNGPMQPRYCSIVPPGTEYVGINDIAAQQATAGSSFIEISSQSAEITDEINGIALDKAFVTFLVYVWLHRFHPQLFHGKPFESENTCLESSIQFLVHPSGTQRFHKEYFEQISETRKVFRRMMSGEPRDKKEFFNNYFLPAYKNTIEKLHKSGSVLLGDIHIQPCWEYIFEILADENTLKLLQINSQERQRRQKESASGRGSLVPISQAEWRQKKINGWILVGGNILGRGLAIPHLVVTLFLRNPRHPNFDTAVQQMRFCGYRRSYLKLIKVFAPTDVISSYKTAVAIDTPFRARALRWHQENRDLKLFPPIMRFVAPKGSNFRPTRNAVISSEVSSRTTTKKSGFFSLGKISEQKIFTENLDLIIDLSKHLQKIDEDTNENVSYFRLDDESLNVLFKKFKVNSDEAKDFRGLLELASYSEEEKGLASFEKNIAIDNFILNQTSSDYFLDKVSNNFDELVNSCKYGRSVSNARKLTLDKWLSGTHTEEFAESFIQTVVGDGERLIHKPKPDTVLIHFRLYKLNNDKSKIIGFGISAIGWIPEEQDDFQVFFNEEAAVG